MKEKILAKNKTFHLTDLIRIKLEDAYTEHDKFLMRNKIEKIIMLCKSARKAPLTSFAKMLEKRICGIMSYAEFRITSGKVEATNRVIKTIRRQAYGFNDDEYFFLRIIDHSRKSHPT